MKLVVISSAPLILKQKNYYAYSPFVKELMIWAQQEIEIGMLCPIWKEDNGLLISPILFPIKKIFPSIEFNSTNLFNGIKSFFVSFLNLYYLIQAMIWADHIHLRCPGNIGLLGCVVQIFFPKKIKTAKYAGNWDPHSKQPWSYKLQRWILQNTFLSRNMTVLVYGEWPNMSRNCISFFTASYCESDKINTLPRVLDSPIQCLFVGSLTAGKNPFYAIQLVETVSKMGVSIQLSLYGDGDQRAKLEGYCAQNSLLEQVKFFGNQETTVVQKAYQSSHFLLLPSQSEGWPKAVAEAMFWGCVPLVTPVSCVPFMLHEQTRGLLLSMDLMQDAQQLFDLLQQPADYESKAEAAMNWSRQYTLDQFKVEISKLLRP
jgi:glycosyltransferase involved in cell wall biosynthesis